MGLKRLGTVLRSRNRNSIFHRSASPDKRQRGPPPPLPPPPPHNRLDSPRDGAGGSSMPGVSPTSDKDSPLTPSQSNGDHRPLSPLSSPPASSSGPPSVTVTAVPEEVGVIALPVGAHLADDYQASHRFGRVHNTPASKRLGLSRNRRRRSGRSPASIQGGDQKRCYP